MIMNVWRGISAISWSVVRAATSNESDIYSRGRRKLRARIIGMLMAVILSIGLVAAPAAAKTRCADFNGDHQVTLEDAYIVASYFGTYPGSPVNEDGNHYSARYDLNNSGNINISDIMLVLLQIGR